MFERLKHTLGGSFVLNYNFIAYVLMFVYMLHTIYDMVVYVVFELILSNGQMCFQNTKNISLIINVCIKDT